MHLEDGLHIEKTPNGFIKIGIFVDGLGMVRVITPDAWISAIAEMSSVADPALAVQQARDFHEGKLAGEPRSA